jgi:holo-[acyl-carrier protein] synthase
MICGIGIDLVQIKRVEKILNRWQERFTGRAFTSGEIEYCRDKAMPEIHYSARFAAKEAFLKSAGVGLGEGIWLTDIEVRKGPHRPVLRLHGKAKELMQVLGIKCSHVSLSHTGGYATAIVILEM